MPMYPYECENCGFSDDEYQSIRDDKLTDCPRCEAGTYERRIAQRVHSGNTEFQTPIEMHSLAPVHEDEIRAFKRRYPGIQCSTNPNDPLYGVPVVKSRAEKKLVLEGEGWEEKN